MSTPEPLTPQRLAEIRDGGAVDLAEARDELLAEINRLAEALADVLADRKHYQRQWHAADQALTAERARVQRVEALAEPYLGQPSGYQHYAVVLTDGVHFAVLVDDLRTALAGDTEGVSS